MAIGLEKAIFIPIPKKGNMKGCSDFCTTAVIPHANKVMLKILQARFQQYVNREHPDVQVGFRGGTGTSNKIANICWIKEKAKEFQKTSISTSLTMLKPLSMWITTNCGKFFNSWEHQAIWLASWATCMQATKQQNWTWNNAVIPNWERSTLRLCLVTLLI